MKSELLIVVVLVVIVVVDTIWIDEVLEKVSLIQ